jgi:hypothetical protein
MTTPRDPKPGECWVKKTEPSKGRHLTVRSVSAAEREFRSVEFSARGDRKRQGESLDWWRANCEPCPEHAP